MNAIPYDGPEEEWDSYEDEQEVALPGRPRRKVLTWWSAGLFAVLLGLVGFYVGVRVEKHQLRQLELDQRVCGGSRRRGRRYWCDWHRDRRLDASGCHRVGCHRVGCHRVHARRRRWRQRLPGPVRRRGRWKRLGRDGLEHQRRLALHNRDFG